MTAQPAAREPLVPTPLERATLRLFMSGAVLQGLWWSGYLLIPYVLAKSLHASTGLITLTAVLDNLGMFLALYWGHLLATRGQRRSYLVWAGIMGRLVMLATLLVQDAVQMSVLLAVVYFFAAMVYPAQNNIFEQNIRPSLRGRYFGLGTGIQNGVAVAASLLLGWILDRDPDAFRVVYAVLGVCGFLYLFLLSRAPVPEGTPPETTPFRLRRPLPWPARAVGPFQPGRIWRGVAKPFADAMRIYREDRAFNWFEINFMTYGAAFMCLSPVVPVFLSDTLQVELPRDLDGAHPGRPGGRGAAGTDDGPRHGPLPPGAAVRGGVPGAGFLPGGAGRGGRCGRRLLDSPGLPGLRRLHGGHGRREHHLERGQHGLRAPREGRVLPGDPCGDGGDPRDHRAAGRVSRV